MSSNPATPSDAEPTSTETEPDMRKGGIMLLVFGGILLCFTLVGGVIGIPMVLYGRHLWYKHGYDGENGPDSGRAA